MRETGLQDQLSDQRYLSQYGDESEFRADRDHIEILQPLGFANDILGPANIRALETELTHKIGKAVLFSQNRYLKGPYQPVVKLVDRFTAMGGRIERGELPGFARADRVTGVQLKDGRTLPVDEALICAVAFSGALAKMLGEPILLETERGYHTQIMARGITMQH